MSTFLFSSFSKPTKELFKTQSLPHGATLFSEGDEANFVYFVESGCVRMVVYPKGGKELVLYRARSGEAFAEEHLMTDYFNYTAIADEDTALIVAPKKEVLSEFSHDHLVARSFMNCVSKRYYQLRVNFERLGIKSASERVLHFLNSQNFVEGSINLSGKVKSISQDLNLTHEATYRALRDLENRGCIQRNDGQIRLL